MISPIPFVAVISRVSAKFEGHVPNGKPLLRIDLLNPGSHSLCRRNDNRSSWSAVIRGHVAPERKKARRLEVDCVVALEKQLDPPPAGVEKR